MCGHAKALGGVPHEVHLDEDGGFKNRCNPSMVQLEPVLAEAEQEAKAAKDIWHLHQSDEAILKGFIEKHARYTGSARARTILENWADYRTKFVKVFPTEYRRALGEMAAKNGKMAA